MLCEELGVSRTVVRESIKSLVAKGLILTGPKVGTRVMPSEQWNWFDPDVIAWQSRPGSPPSSSATCRTCGAWWSRQPSNWRQYAHTPADIADIEAAFAGMKQAVEHGGDYVTHDLRFHQGLLRASRNRMLVQMSKALSALLRTSFEISTGKTDGPGFRCRCTARCSMPSSGATRRRPNAPFWCS